MRLTPYEHLDRASPSGWRHPSGPEARIGCTLSRFCDRPPTVFGPVFATVLQQFDDDSTCLGYPKTVPKPGETKKGKKLVRNDPKQYGKSGNFWCSLARAREDSGDFCSGFDISPKGPGPDFGTLSWDRSLVSWDPQNGSILRHKSSLTPVYKERLPVYKERFPVYKEGFPVYKERFPVYKERFPVYKERFSV